MDADAVIRQKENYEAMSDEQLSEILAVSAKKDSLTDEAKIALSEVLRHRGLTVEQLLIEREQDIQADEKKIKQGYMVRAQRNRFVTKWSGKLIGLIGIPASLAVSYQSVIQSHALGAISALVWFGLSVWLLFYYKGD